MSKFFGFAILAATLGFGSSVYAQPALTLSSNTAAAGGTVALNLSISSPSGSQPAGVQWTMTYPSASIASLSVTAGAAATAAGKSIACSGGAAGYTCVASGINSNTISNGVVAVVTATLTSSAATSSISIPNALGTSVAGEPVTVSATGGTITIPTSTGTGTGTTTTPPTTPGTVAVSSVSCSPGSIASGASSTCTVTLSGTAGADGSKVTLSSSVSSTILTVPASITIASGGSSGTFTVTAGTISSGQTATIGATLYGSTVSTSLPLVPPAVVSSLQCVVASLAQNASTSCTVTISPAAPTGGTVVTITSSTTALTVPASVTVAANATTAPVPISSGVLSSSTTATITATLNGSSAKTTVALVAPATVSALQCTATSLAQNASTSCTVTISKAAPSTGTSVTLTSSTTALKVPASVTVNSGAASASFTASTGTLSASQTATISATISGAATSVSATISLTAPTTTTSTELLITGSASEAAGTANGSTVTPTTAPSGLTGKTVVNGTGSINFLSGSGVYFLNCCSNTNNAYYKFTGASLANVFGNSTGQVSFTLKSRYTFSQRESSAAAQRYTFDARDGNGVHQYYFFTQIVSESLVFSYGVGGTNFSYSVPAGTEDKLFGSAVSLNVQLTWNGSTANLYLNGTQVQSSPYVPASASWSKASNFDLGAYEYQTSGGYNSSDDLISQFTVTGPAAGGSAKRTLVSSSATAKPSASMAALPAGEASLSCDSSVEAGSSALCRLQIHSGSSADSIAFSIASSSEYVQVPAGVATREGQTTVSFQVLTNAAAPSGTIAIEAISGAAVARASLEVVHTEAPAMLVPRDQTGTPGTPLHFDVIVSDPQPYSVYAAGLPAAASFDTSTGAVSWVPSAQDSGTHVFVFTAVNSLGLSTHKTVTVNVVNQRPETAPQILTVGDGDQALAFHAGTSLLAGLPSARFDGEPARAGDSLTIAIAGIDCNQELSTRNFQLQFAGAFATIQSLQPAGGTPAVCQVSVEVPSGITGPQAAISVTMAVPGGKAVSSNTASVAVEE